MVISCQLKAPMSIGSFGRIARMVNTTTADGTIAEAVERVANHALRQAIATLALTPQ